nr:acyl-CoA thioesterase II [Flavobacteriaceae bacterium]
VGSPNVFGGQVLAQALNAAYRTITNNRILNSMHGYFLEPGNLELPINYEVGIIRDGGSFSTRRVTAKQNGLTIFILACSYHKKEEGYDHHFKMNEAIKPPEELLSWSEMSEKYGLLIPKRMKEFLDIPRPVDFKPVEPMNPNLSEDKSPYTDVWFKLKGDAIGLDLASKQQILTYISDYYILSVMFFPHASKAHWGNTRTASLDHSMWYFRDFEFDDWMLFSVDSPSTSGARGFCRGNIFTRDGRLLASVAQEGLMRPKG